MWLWGGMLYIWMMSLIFYRYTFFEFSAEDLPPPYWINMGAMGFDFLAYLPVVLFHAALFARTLTFVGATLDLVRRIGASRTWRKRRRAQSG